MKSTPSSARRIARSVLIAVWPTYWPTSDGAVDLDEMSLLEKPHRAVHLGEEPGDCGLPGAGVAEEDEVLARGHLGQVVLLAARLDLEERDEPVNLLLDGLEAHEAVEFCLDLCERSWLGPGAEPVGEELLDLRTRRPTELVAQVLDRVAKLVEWVHAAKVAPI